MPGVIVNAVAIMIGAFAGLFIKNGLSVRFKTMITNSVGLACSFVGLAGALNGLTSGNAHPVLFIISLVIGGLLGERIDIDALLNGFGLFVEKKVGASGFSKGFVSASLLFCVGSMAIIGSIEAGVIGNYNTLFAKSVLDGITSIVLAASYGFGVIFSGISVFLYQGAITLMAAAVQSFLTDDMIREISIVGGILITCIGIDLLDIKKFKVANFLPAVFVPVVFYLIMPLFS